MTGRSKELSEIIISAKLELNEIKRNCKHENFIEGLYSWREGSTVQGTICNDCGEFLSGFPRYKILENEANK